MSNEGGAASGEENKSSWKKIDFDIEQAELKQIWKLLSFTGGIKWMSTRKNYIIAIAEEDIRHKTI